MPDYLYEPAWPDEQWNEKATEYSPNYYGRKIRRLIMEGGGVWPKDGLGLGPGGSIWIRLGPSGGIVCTENYFWRCCGSLSHSLSRAEAVQIVLSAGTFDGKAQEILLPEAIYRWPTQQSLRSKKKYNCQSFCWYEHQKNPRYPWDVIDWIPESCCCVHHFPCNPQATAIPQSFPLMLWPLFSEICPGDPHALSKRFRWEQQISFLSMV